MAIYFTPKMGIAKITWIIIFILLFQNQLYMYGGIVGNNISNELWMFHIGLRTWTLIRDSTWEDRQLAVSGHTAHVVRGIMHVLFGYSPVYGFLPFVQEFHFRKSLFLVCPIFAHSYIFSVVIISDIELI